MKKIIAIVVGVAGIALGLYLGVWLLCVSPILEACRHFDNGTLTGIIIGNTIIKCCFAGFGFSVPTSVGLLLAGKIAEDC